MPKILQTLGLLTLVGGLAAPVQAQTCTGPYSLARAAVPSLASTGDLAFIAYQQDAPKHAGTLKAFQLNADGSTDSTPTWDANRQATEAHRQAGLYTNLSLTNGTLQTLDSLSDGILGAALKTLIYGGAKALLGVTWDSWYGKPEETTPVVHKDLVLFATNDGFLYGLNKASGEMQWGWTPRSFLSALTDLIGKSLLGDLLKALPLLDLQKLFDNNPMRGQFQVVTVKQNDYVLGTAKGGSLHYALALTSTGGLDKVVWQDSASGNVTAAPVLFLDKTFYVTGNQLVWRGIAADDTQAGSDAVPVTGGATVSTAPVVVKVSEDNTETTLAIYVGDSSGTVHTRHYAYSKSSGSINLVSSEKWATVPMTGTGIDAPGRIQHLIYTQTLGAEYLTAQSDTRITTTKRRLPVDNKNPWRAIWSSTRGGSQQLKYADGKAASANTVPELPSGAVITDRATSVGGFLLTPVGLGSDCSSDARLYRFALDPEVAYYRAFQGALAWTEAFVTVGKGRAVSSSALYLNGKLSALGHSQQNGVASALGLDNPLEFRPLSTYENTDLRRRSWREIIR